jgi:hypothetical protein
MMAGISCLNGQGRCGSCCDARYEDRQSQREGATRTNNAGDGLSNGGGRSTESIDMMADMFMAMMTMMNSQLMLSSAQQSNVWNDL